VWTDVCAVEILLLDVVGPKHEERLIRECIHGNFDFKTLKVRDFSEYGVRSDNGEEQDKDECSSNFVKCMKSDPQA